MQPAFQPLAQPSVHSSASGIPMSVGSIPMSVNSVPMSVNSNPGLMNSHTGSEMAPIMLVPVMATHPSVQAYPTPLSSGAYSSFPATEFSTPSTSSMYHYSSYTYTPPPASHAPLEDPPPSIAVLDETKRVVDGPIAERGPRRPKLGNNVEGTCPILGALHRGNELPELLPVHKLRFTAQVHIAVVVVTCELETEATEHLGKAHRLVVYCPKTTHSTFTEARVENLSKPLIATTVLVPVDEVQAAAQPFRPPQGDGYEDMFAGPDYDDPNLFIFEIPQQFSFKAGHKFKVTLCYFEPLVFWEGKYSMRLPTTVPSKCLPNRQPIQSILEVTTTVDIGLPLDVQLEVNQPVHETEAEDGCGVQTVKLDTEAQLTNIDFELHYKVWGGNINAACYTQPPCYGADLKPAPPPSAPGLIPTANNVTVESANGAHNGGAAPIDDEGVRLKVPLAQLGRLDNLPTFCVALAPPDPNNSDRHARAVVFILDRSGSMQGKPLEYAMQAVLVGLAMLGPDDVFTACCFDHEVDWWSGQLVPASKDNVSKCEAWIQSNFCARGLTDIRTPLMQAMDLLDASQELPFIFLMTDGCTADERDICREVDERLSAKEVRGPHKTRINTFAIGPFANHYFLKHLALTARGLFDVAYRANSIQVQMEQMLAACAHPVLSDVSIRVPGLDDSCVAVLPEQLPDLFCGLPLVVVGKYAGQWPDQVVLRGRRPGGNHDWLQEVSSTPVESDVLPLGKIWAKAFLDRETAEAWRRDDKKAVQRIIATSIATGVPCHPYTQMVGIAMQPDEFDQMRADMRINKRQKVVKYALAGSAGIALVAGAAAVMSVGDLGATIQNIPFDVINADCCECCGHCCGSLVAGGCVIS